jgi:tetratricopeptide (TPR) repeat protein
MIENPDISQKEFEKLRTLVSEGIARHKAGKIASAKKRYREALKIDPNEADALHFMGVLCHQQGRNNEAISYLQRAVNARERFAPALQNLSKILLIEERYHEALEVAEHTLSFDENAHHALRTMAHAYQELHQFKNACRIYRRIDALFPNEVGTIRNLALSLSGLRRRDEAVAEYRRALKIEPENIITRIGLAGALNAAGAFDEAIIELDAVLARKPEYVPALVHKGSALEGLDRFDEATELFREAIRIDPHHPEAHFNLGLALLSTGDLQSGWDEYAWRLRTQAFIKQKPPTTAPIWQGEDIDGKSILLFPEQGLGDSIQFVRYARLLNERGATVYCCCHRPLLNLLRPMEGVSGVYLLGEQLPPVNYQVSMMELPRVLRTNIDSIPLAEGYLKAPDVSFDRPEGLSVGLVWQGNPSHARDMLRSIPLREMAPVIEVENVHFFSLQVGSGEAQISACGQQDRIRNLSDRLADFSVTAGVIDKLDLVISVDTSVAHVAGAIGKPLWLMLPTAADWRWGRDSITSPWYRSMKLFRQNIRGDWSGVTNCIKTELQTLAKQY